jgi:hypothetical protein
VRIARVLIALLAAVAVLAAGAALGFAVVDEAGPPGGGAPERKYSTTEDGRTYGTLPTEGPVIRAEMPGLIRVVGENGVEGYASADELFGEDDIYLQPEEIERQQASAPKVETVNVYAEDGVTVVDTFDVGAGEHEVIETHTKEAGR